MGTLKIKTSKYNEVAPSSLEDIMKNGGVIIKSEHHNGKLVSMEYNAYSDDSVKINNMILPLSIGEPAYYDCEISINVK